MGSKYNNDYSDVDWETEINEFFSCHTTIKRFSEGKPYSYWAISNRLRKDPRYHSRTKQSKRMEEDKIRFLPVVIESHVRNEDVIYINGFELRINAGTDPEEVKVILEAMRQL